MTEQQNCLSKIPALSLYPKEPNMHISRNQDMRTCINQNDKINHLITNKAIKSKIGTLILPFLQFNHQPAIARGSDPDPFRTRKSNLSSLLNTDLRERLESSSAGVPLNFRRGKIGIIAS